MACRKINTTNKQVHSYYLFSHISIWQLHFHHHVSMPKLSTVFSSMLLLVLFARYFLSFLGVTGENNSGGKKIEENPLKLTFFEPENNELSC